MTREEAEEIYMAVEVGFGSYYNISEGSYAEALLILQGEHDDAVSEEVG